MLPREKKIHTKEQLNTFLSVELPFYECDLIRRIFAINEKAILRKHQVLLRKAEYYSNVHNMILSFWYRFRLCLIQNKYGLHIPINCCDLGLHILHLGPILINSHAQLGKYCSLHINTAIVANGKTGDAPSIGDHVVLGVGAVVIGPVNIANYTAVGANAVVNKDVLEENITIAGVPAKKISSSGRKEWKRLR